VNITLGTGEINAIAILEHVKLIVTQYQGCSCGETITHYSQNMIKEKYNQENNNL